MIEMLLSKYGVSNPGLQGNVYGRTQKSIIGNGMKMSSSGKFLASGYLTGNSGTGEVYISDLTTLTAPYIKRTIRLPDWKPGGAAGVYSRAGQIVRGSNDLATVATNTSPDGIDKGAIYVMSLDPDHNVVGSTKIYPAGIGSGDYFASYFDVSGNGNLLVASSIGYNSFNGRVHIYSRNGGTWTLEKIIDKPTGSSCMRFGTPVTLSEDGEFMAVSGIPSAVAGSSKVYLFKRNGGAWDLAATIADTRNLSGGGRISGYISGDSKKLAVTYSYHSSTAGTPEGGVDFYTVNPTTGAVTLTDTVPNGIAGGGYNIQPFMSHDGSAFLGSASLPAGNQFNGMNCIQLNETTGKYEQSWSFTTPAIAQSPIYPVCNAAGTIWAAACPSLVLIAQDSFFCGR